MDCLVGHEGKNMDVMEKEMVLCVMREKLPATWLGTRRALPMSERACFWGLEQANPRFSPRHRVETDNAYKQIIPYVVVTMRGDGKIACYRRQGTEERLHGLDSCGIGGHIGKEDGMGDVCDVRQAVYRGLTRELEEEFSLRLSSSLHAQFCGVINDDETPVGAVHLGLVFHVEIDCPGEVKMLFFAEEIKRVFEYCN